MSVDESVRSLSMDYLNLLINGQAFSDVSFCVEGRVVPAHRCILAARSLFFRRFFSDPSASSAPAAQPPPVIPVTSVSYEVFMLMLQFLYTGQVSVLPQKHEPRPNCSDRSCLHSHCSSAVDLALDTLSAARSFGVEQLASLTQKQLSIMVEKASIDDVMRVLLASRKQETQPLWFTCSHLVAKSGLPAEILAKHLPIDVVASIEDLRLKSTRRHHNDHQQSHHHPYHLHDLAELEEHKIRRMRRALDSSDVELVKMMVMGEGLSLDAALALHYAVQSSTREVVKALLELGAANVNYPAGPAGKTPLHLAAEMVSPDMVAVLLDHHADPTARTVEGVTPLDVLRGLTSDFLFKGAIPGLAHVEPNKLRLCLELVQSAAMVILREEGNDNHNNNNDGGEQNSVSPGSSGNMGGLNVDSRMVYLHLGGRVGSGQTGEDESAPSNMGRATHW
ncbi:hypothetical protein V2J09_015998 [Rumex salicifolius]